jgi:hypothetical protein
MIGRQGRPCMNLLGCIDDSAWFLKALLCCSRLFLVVIFGALFLVVFLVCFRDLALGNLMGKFV